MIILLRINFKDFVYADTTWIVSKFLDVLVIEIQHFRRSALFFASHANLAGRLRGIGLLVVSMLLNVVPENVLDRLVDGKTCNSIQLVPVDSLVTVQIGLCKGM